MSTPLLLRSRMLRANLRRRVERWRDPLVVYATSGRATSQGWDVRRLAPTGGIIVRRRVLRRAAREAIRCETLAEAVRDTASCALYVPVYVNRSGEEDYDYVSVAFVDGHHAGLLVQSQEHDSWVAAAGRSGRPARRRMLEEVLGRFRISARPDGEAIADPEAWHRLSTHAAMLHWWDQQIGDGLDAHTVKVMLALSVGTDVMRRIEWSPAGHPIPRTR